MKSNKFAIATAIVAAMTLTTFCACDDEVASPSFSLASPTSKADEALKTKAIDMVYPGDDTPAGKSYPQWAEIFIKTAFTLDCGDHKAFQLLRLDDHVVALYGSLEFREVYLNIRADDFLFVPLYFNTTEYPCPDPFNTLLPGQKLESYLLNGVNEVLNEVSIYGAQLDEKVIENPQAFRMTSGLFEFIGNPDLVNCEDSCITGQTQSAVTGGYYLMFKPLTPGEHTLRFQGGMPRYQYDFAVTFHLTVK